MLLTYNVAGRLRLSFQEESLPYKCQELSVKTSLKYLRFVTGVAVSSMTSLAIMVSPSSPCGSWGGLVGTEMTTRFITHDHLMPRFRMTVATPPLPLTTYMACSEKTFAFTFALYLVTIHMFYVFQR